MGQSPNKPNIFICFAHEDQDLYEKLRRHLGYLERVHSCYICSNNEINPGDNRKEAINRSLNSADLVLLLISSDFMYSDHCYKVMRDALELGRKRRTKVVAVLLRPFLGQDDQFIKNKILPENGIPLTQWNDIDQACVSVRTSIGEIILGLPNSWKPQRNSAQKYYIRSKRREFKRYISVCNRAINFNPNDAEAYSNKGWALCELKRFRKAIPVLEKAVRLNPNDAAAYLNKGEALYELKRFEKAIPDLKQAMYLNPYDPIARLIKGEALYKLERFEEAIPDLKQAIRLDPFLDRAYLVEGRALRKLERFEEAISDLKEAVRLNPYNSVAAYSSRESTLWNNETRRSRYAIIGVLVLIGLGGASYEYYSLVYLKKALTLFTFNSTNSVAPKKISKPSKSSPTNPPKIQVTPVIDKARYVIQQYYEAINKQDYRTAYNLWQVNVTGNGQSYDQFVRGYGNTLHDDITFVSVVPQDNNTFKVDITIHATERDGTGTYSAYYTVGAVGGSWKIISGSVKKMAFRNTPYIG